MRRAFEGFKVIDASQGVAGPHAAMLLALHGADVIKIEPPEGDWGRILGKAKAKNTIHFVAFNRGKRSIAIDLTKEEGRRIATDLVTGADVVIESFRPGVAARLGLGYSDAIKVNPNLIYMSVSGYGQQGPNRDRPAVDGVIQAYSGMMVMNGSVDKPHRQGMVVIDTVTGLYGFQAVSAALMRKVRFGTGSFIDMSLMQSAAAFQAAKLMEAASEGPSPGPLYSPSGVYETADGHVLLSTMRSRAFEVLCGILGCPQLATDARFSSVDGRNANRHEMNRVLTDQLRTRTTDEWVALMLERGVMASPIKSYTDWLADAHVKAVDGYQTLPFAGVGSLPVAAIPGCPGAEIGANGAVPGLGEHTTQILSSLGRTDVEIASLYSARVLS
ncbi:CoA transferase [Bradyrhizobium sp. UNPF46]|uniref:CaiB/BaiF CoA transferase family protein n=1 Tax=Bradyrhizobium sp. UNPF46 TaxID=1141168 RepID=UPI0015F03B05|nr:CoA transferase [Bradyrhizobium sp. UNPF46]